MRLFCLTLRSFTEQKIITLLAILADLKHMFDNCDICKGGAVLISASFLRDGTRIVQETYISKEISTDVHTYHRTSPVVINALTKLFLRENVPQKAHDLVTQAAQRLEEGNQEFTRHLSKGTVQYYHIFIAMERVDCYVRGSKLSIREEILEEE